MTTSRSSSPSRSASTTRSGTPPPPRVMPGRAEKTPPASWRSQSVPRWMSRSPSPSRSPTGTCSWLVVALSTDSGQAAVAGSSGIDSMAVPEPPLCQESTTSSWPPAISCPRLTPWRKSPPVAALVMSRPVKTPAPSLRAQERSSPPGLPSVPRMSRSPSLSRSCSTATLLSCGLSAGALMSLRAQAPPRAPGLAYHQPPTARSGRPSPSRSPASTKTACQGSEVSRMCRRQLPSASGVVRFSHISTTAELGAPSFQLAPKMSRSPSPPMSPTRRLCEPDPATTCCDQAAPWPSLK